MTKEEYIVLRGEVVISPLLFYMYYLDHRTENDPELLYREFEIHFSKFFGQVANSNVVMTSKGLKYMNFNAMLDKVYTYLNKKFDVAP